MRAGLKAGWLASSYWTNSLETRAGTRRKWVVDQIEDSRHAAAVQDFNAFAWTVGTLEATFVCRCVNIVPVRIVQMYKSDVWLIDVSYRCMNQMYESDVWIRCINQMYESDVWIRCMNQMYESYRCVNQMYESNVYRTDVWIVQMYESDVYRTDVWFRCMIRCILQMYRTDVWIRCMNQMCESDGMNQMVWIRCIVQMYESDVWIVQMYESDVSYICMN